jgi:hypothetical protein
MFRTLIAGQSRPFRTLVPGCCLAGLFFFEATRAYSAQDAQTDGRDLVAVGIVRDGRAIVLATPGVPGNGRTFSFRSFNTRALPQPIRDVALALSGTKLFIQTPSGRGVVLDLTRQYQHHVPLQYVKPDDGAKGHRHRKTHRLPSQRFVDIRDGVAYVIDDGGAVQPEYPALNAMRAVISGDGVALYVRPDGTMVICGENESSRGVCRELPIRPQLGLRTISARSLPPRAEVTSPRFAIVTGTEKDAVLLDPEQYSLQLLPMRRAEVSLLASLYVNGMYMSNRDITSLVDALERESAETSAAGGEPITDWQFFRVATDEELYAPVLQFAPGETIFPSAFDTLEQLGPTTPTRGAKADDRLYDKYLRLDEDARQNSCTFYSRTHSMRGSWLIEYWLYYPFDVGGLMPHPHDPEHFFVVVDKLGGTVRTVVGAGHGYLAANNIYSADKPGARALDLPLFAIVELGKHATAPDVNRDGVFTPGVDENAYGERAKVWGVRDVIGTINNQVLTYEETMSVVRKLEFALALASVTTRYPHETDLASRGACQLVPLSTSAPETRNPLFRLSDWVITPPCHDLSEDCAQRHVTSHPDYVDPRTVFKEWAFPDSFLRATYSLGPGPALRSGGLGYAMDLTRIPAVGRVLPLPGRIGADVFYFRQTRDSVGDACATVCERSGVGWGVRYEQFLSNLFGISSGVRVYSPPIRDAWITFGPFMEVPLGRRSNLNLAGGLSFGPVAPARFELRMSVGVWKPKTYHLGVRAGKDHGR